MAVVVKRADERGETCDTGGDAHIAVPRTWSPYGRAITFSYEVEGTCVRALVCRMPAESDDLGDGVIADEPISGAVGPGDPFFSRRFPKLVISASSTHVKCPSTRGYPCASS